MHHRHFITLQFSKLLLYCLSCANLKSSTKSKLSPSCKADVVKTFKYSFGSLTGSGSKEGVRYAKHDVFRMQRLAVEKMTRIPLEIPTSFLVLHSCSYLSGDHLDLAHIQFQSYLFVCWCYTGPQRMSWLIKEASFCMDWPI